VFIFARGTADMVKIAHIVNPVAVSPKSDLFVAQPIVFESMRVAKQIANQQGIFVEQYAAQFPEDEVFSQQYLPTTPNLQRSILDLGSFKISRKLPLLVDILDRLYRVSEDCDYLVYSNVDITLMPYFYVTIAQLTQQGYDALVVNRRTIPAKYNQPSSLALMYAEVGKKHAGHDCFIFRREAYPNYRLENVIIGASLVGVTLLVNLICNAQKFKEFTNLHLTFHLGDDQAWRSTDLDDYTHHNLVETNKVVDFYVNQNRLVEHQLIKRFLENRDIEFWLNRKPSSKPSFRTRLRRRVSSYLRRVLP
jgi:hypothetical protein